MYVRALCLLLGMCAECIQSRLLCAEIESHHFDNARVYLRLIDDDNDEKKKTTSADTHQQILQQRQTDPVMTDNTTDDDDEVGCQIKLWTHQFFSILFRMMRVVCFLTWKSSTENNSLM